MKKPIELVAVLLAAAAVAACSEDPIGQNGVAQLTLSWDSVIVDVGASSSVTATVSNSSEPAQFVSRDQSVATVNASGAISGVAVGSTYVVATLANRADVRDSVRVRVKAPPIFADPCPLLRPNFGVATEADRAVFAYDVNAPLNLKKTVRATNAVFELSNISYNSPDGGLVTGIMAVPVGRSGLRPGIVIMHPSGNPTSPIGVEMEVPNALMFAVHGAVVIAIDAPFVRRGGDYLPLFTTQDRDEQVQLIKDLQRAVDVLRARDDVDDNRIAFIGYSLGGIIGAEFVGIERRLKAAVLAAANGGHLTHATTPANLPFMASMSCATRSTWYQAMAPIESIRFIPNSSPTALLFQMGRFDNAVLPQDTEVLYNAAAAPKEILRYDTGHSLNLQALADRHEWLHQQIGIDAQKSAP